MTIPRVAIFGLALESNRWSRPAAEEDFKSVCWLEGDAILHEARLTTPAMPMEAAAFVKAMDATGPWQPVPILIASSFPAGPIEQATFEQALGLILASLEAALPLDATYICNHGAMTATHTFDPDGEIVTRVRQAIGPKARLVMTLDLHANISERMVASCDIVIGYRTNPHVDMLERGEEAAFALRRMLVGLAEPKTAIVRLPLTPASVNLLTNAGPYGELIDYGQKRQAEHSGAILNVSIFGGFVFSDTPKNGIATVVTARSDRALARALANEISDRAWGMRSRFRKTLMPVAEAVALANARARAPVIYADSGDNPGGGGSGRTTELLMALHAAGARDLIYGSFFDPAGIRGAQARQGCALSCPLQSRSWPGTLGAMGSAVRSGSGSHRPHRRALHRQTRPIARPQGQPRGLRRAAHRRPHGRGDLGTQPDRRPNVLRNVRHRHRQGEDRDRQITWAFSRWVPAVVPA
jgi:microcystin degradation protein MlrC